MIGDTCHLGTIRDEGVEGFQQRSFDNKTGSVLYSNLTYDQVGHTYFVVKEERDSEWAKVDAKDTPRDQLQIPSKYNATTFIPASFVTRNFSISSNAGLSTHAYFDTPLSSGATISYDLVAVGKSGNTTTNFDKGCYSYDVTTDHTLTPTVAPQTALKIVDGTGVRPFDGQNLPSVTVPGSSFTQGVAKVKLNFGITTPSRQTVTNPLKISGGGTDLVSTVRDANGTVGRSVLTPSDAPAARSAAATSPAFAFLFGRIHPTQVVALAGDTTAKSTLYYEAYCLASDCASLGLGTASVSGEPGWYQNPHQATGILNLSHFTSTYRPTALDQGVTIPGTQTLSGFSHLPVGSQVRMDITHGTAADLFPEYLLYHPVSSAKVTSFYVRIDPTSSINRPSGGSGPSTGTGVGVTTPQSASRSIGASRIGE